MTTRPDPEDMKTLVEELNISAGLVAFNEPARLLFARAADAIEHLRRARDEAVERENATRRANLDCATHYDAMRSALAAAQAENAALALRMRALLPSMTDDEIATLGELEKEATPAPWLYRPQPHDDWGYIRSADGEVVATARAGRFVSETEKDEQRRAKTDPYARNAVFIACARSAVPRLIAALAAAQATIAMSAVDGFAPGARVALVGDHNSVSWSGDVDDYNAGREAIVVRGHQDPRYVDVVFTGEYVVLSLAKALFTPLAKTAPAAPDNDKKMREGMSAAPARAEVNGSAGDVA